MKHLIISREYPPAPYPPGGIGTYVANIARLMADQGETVHLIAQRWEGAPNAREVAHDGRLIIHRIGQNDLPPTDRAGQAPRLLCELEGLKNTASYKYDRAKATCGPGLGRGDEDNSQKKISPCRLGRQGDFV